MVGRERGSRGWREGGRTGSSTSICRAAGDVSAIRVGPPDGAEFCIYGTFVRTTVQSYSIIYISGGGTRRATKVSIPNNTIRIPRY